MLPRRAPAIAVLALLASCAFSSASAAAAPGTYSVEICTASSSTQGGSVTRNAQEQLEGSGLFFEEKTKGSMLLEPCAGNALVVQNPPGGIVPAKGDGFVSLIAPEGALIKQVHFSAPFVRAANLREPSDLTWFASAGGFSLLDPTVAWREDGRAFFPAEGGGTFETDSLSVSMGMVCTEEKNNCGPGNFKATIHNFSAQLEDRFLPAAAVTPLASRTLRGTAAIGFQAVDKGSGIAKVELLVDGKEAGSIADDNGGKCTTPYKYVQPCKLELDSAFQLDTTKLAEGLHEIVAVVTDASGLQGETQPVTILVHNAPLNAARPAIQGSPALGSKLVATPGQWVGAPTGLAFRWFRCPATVKSDEGAEACGEISGASGPEYTTGTADLGQRDLVQVTATNAFGSESKISFPTDVIEKPGSNSKNGSDKPKVSHPKVSPKSFRVSPTLSKKGKRAAVLAFSCDRGGQMSIAIRRPRRHGKPKPMGKLVATIKAGRNRVLLTGEIGKRRLRPGHYEALVRVTDAKGSVSDPAAVRFTILPG